LPVGWRERRGSSGHHPRHRFHHEEHEGHEGSGFQPFMSFMLFMVPPCRARSNPRLAACAAGGPEPDLCGLGDLGGASSLPGDSRRGGAAGLEVPGRPQRKGVSARCVGAWDGPRRPPVSESLLTVIQVSDKFDPIAEGYDVSELIGSMGFAPVVLGAEKRERGEAASGAP